MDRVGRNAAVVIVSVCLIALFGHVLHAPTALSDGRVLIAGGRTATGVTAQHPRDDSGKFASGAGGASAGAAAGPRPRAAANSTVESVTALAQTISGRMHFDPSRIDVVDIEPRKLEVAGRQLHEGGAMIPPPVASRSMCGRIPSTPGCEGCWRTRLHAQHDAVENVQATEHDAIRALMNQNTVTTPDGVITAPEYARLFMRNGFPRTEMIPEIEARFPASAAMAKGAPKGDSYLGTWSQDADGKWAFDEQAYGVTGGRMEQMQKEVGFTTYSKLCWAAYAEATDPLTKALWGQRAVQETLAEVGAYREQAARGSWEEGVPSPSWRRFSAQVRAVYPKIASKVVRPESSATEIK